MVVVVIHHLVIVIVVMEAAEVGVEYLDVLTFVVYDRFCDAPYNVTMF